MTPPKTTNIVPQSWPRLLSELGSWEVRAQQPSPQDQPEGVRPLGDTDGWDKVPGCQARNPGKTGVPSRCPGIPSRPTEARMWPSRSLVAPGSATPMGGGGSSPLPGHARLPGDDNFPATGSSWPGSHSAPAPGSRRWPRRPDQRWRRRQSALKWDARPADGLLGPSCGWDGEGRGQRDHSPGPLGSLPRRAPEPRVPVRALRRCHHPRPPRAPSGWGWGWGAVLSPGCPGRRRPSSSCPRARAHPAGSAGPPWLCVRQGRGRGRARGARGADAGRGRCPPRRPACPPPARRPSLAGRRAWGPPSALRPARWAAPHGLSGEAGRQGPLRSCGEPPLLRSAGQLSSPQAADRSAPGAPGCPRRVPCLAPARLQVDTGPHSPWGPDGSCALALAQQGPAGATISSPGGLWKPERSPGLRRLGEPAEPSEQTTGNY